MGDEFKKNQVSEAIQVTLGDLDDASQLLTSTRIKRLVDEDRAIARESNSKKLAFSSTEPGGQGVDQKYSSADVFRLFIGLWFLAHGWPQNFAVSMVLQVREELDRLHKLILGSAPAKPRKPQAGDPDISVSNSSFLLITSDARTSAKRPEPYARVFKTYADAQRFQLQEPGRSCTYFPLDQAAQTLHQHLLKTSPKRRGRSS